MDIWEEGSFMTGCRLLKMGWVNLRRSHAANGCPCDIRWECKSLWCNRPFGDNQCEWPGTIPILHFFRS